MSDEVVDNAVEAEPDPDVPEAIEVGEGEPEEVEVDPGEEPVEDPDAPPDTEESTSFKDAFKKHPELRKAYFENNKFKEVFSTPEEAQEAQERVQTLADYETAVQEGDVNVIIQSVIDANPTAFNQFASNFLPNLRAMDPTLYNKAIGPEISNILKSAAADAQRNNNKSLGLAVGWISNWLFNSPEPPTFQPDQPQQPRNDQGARARYEDFQTELGTEIDSFLVKEATFNLDPNNVIPPALKKATVREIIEESANILKSDPAAQKILKQLRDQAAKSGFRYESRKKLLEAYVSRMKPIMARVRPIKRNEAMKSIGKAVPITKKVIPSGGTSTSGRTPVDPKMVDWEKTSRMDALSGKYVMKS